MGGVLDPNGEHSESNQIRAFHNVGPTELTGSADRIGLSRLHYIATQVRTPPV